MLPFAQQQGGEKPPIVLELPAIVPHSPQQLPQQQQQQQGGEPLAHAIAMPSVASLLSMGSLSGAKGFELPAAPGLTQAWGMDAGMQGLSAALSLGASSLSSLAPRPRARALARLL